MKHSLRLAHFAQTQGAEQFRSEGMMSKAIGVFATMALIVAVIGIWLRFEPVATEPMTAAGAQAVSNPIFPLELMLKYGESIPAAFQGVDYTHVYPNEAPPESSGFARTQIVCRQEDKQNAH
jgi:hypothetical protein